MKGVMAWGIVCAVFTGVFVVTALDVSRTVLYIVAGISLGSFAFYITTTSVYKQVYLFVLICGCVTGCTMLRSYSIISDQSILSHFTKVKAHLVGAVIAETDSRDTYDRLTVRVSHMTVGQSVYTDPGTILVYTQLHSGVQYGDTVALSGTLEQPKPFETSPGLYFDYPAYLHAQGIDMTMRFTLIDVLKHDQGNPFVALCLYIKSRILYTEHQALPEPYASLAGGILVGDKRSVGPVLAQAFQKTSLTHILVLSGYNVTVVMNWVLTMTQYASHTVRVGIASGISVFFIIIAGGSASAIRAGCISLLSLCARLYMREFDALRVLGIVSAGMLLWNPYLLLFDPSFQLSFLSAFGLIVYTPLVTRYAYWIPEIYGLRELCATTVATQLCVTPYMVYVSGMYSVVGIPANIFVLLVMPIAMMSAVYTGIIGIFGSGISVLATPTYIVLWYIRTVTEWYASLSYASITLPHVSIIIICTWYVVIAYWLAYVRYIERKQRGVDLAVVRARSAKD